MGNGFFVDPAGLNGAYNLLARAREDADDTLGYTHKHCDLAFTDQGFLFMLSGPHRRAYQTVTGALEQLSRLAQGTATQLNSAQLAYAKADLASAGRLDATYPSATDPDDLRGTLASGRPDLRADRPAFSDVAEPTGHLQPPSYATEIQTYQINPLTDLLSPTAWLRQVSVWLFDYDPFEGWAQAISGNWDTYYHCAATWGRIGAAAHDVGRNLITGTADVAAVWRGHAAEAEQEFQLALGRAAMALQPACREYSRLYREAAEAAKHLFVTVSGLIGQLLDLLIIVNVSAAIGTATIETVVGPIAGYAIAAYYTWQAYEVYKKVSSVYQTAEITIRGIAGAIGAVQAGQDLVRLPTLEPYRHPAVE